MKFYLGGWRWNSSTTHQKPTCGAHHFLCFCELGISGGFSNDKTMDRAISTYRIWCWAVGRRFPRSEMRALSTILEISDGVSCLTSSIPGSLNVDSSVAHYKKKAFQTNSNLIARSQSAIGSLDSNVKYCCSHCRWARGTVSTCEATMTGHLI